MNKRKVIYGMPILVFSIRKYRSKIDLEIGSDLREFTRNIVEGLISEDEVLESIPDYEDFKLMQARLGDSI